MLLSVMPSGRGERRRRAAENKNETTATVASSYVNESAL